MDIDMKDWNIGSVTAFKTGKKYVSIALPVNICKAQNISPGDCVEIIVRKIIEKKLSAEEIEDVRVQHA